MTLFFKQTVIVGNVGNVVQALLFVGHVVSSVVIKSFESLVVGKVVFAFLVVCKVLCFFVIGTVVVFLLVGTVVFCVVLGGVVVAFLVVGKVI